MDAREGKAAVADTKLREEEDAATERLLRSVRNYTIVLYVGFIVGALAPRAAVKAAPDAVASARRFLAGGYDLSVTVAFFTTATLLLQSHLARVLKPSPRPRLSPLAAWPLAVVTWLCITSLFLSCLTFGDEDLGGYGEWAVAAGASVANAVMSARTVQASPRLRRRMRTGERCFAGKTECLQNGHGRRIYVYLPCFFFASFRSVRSSSVEVALSMAVWCAFACLQWQFVYLDVV